MKYKFTTKINLNDTIYIVNVEDKFDVLSNFTDAYWTPKKVEEIIEGVNQGKIGDKYEWANEDVHLVSLEQGVFFFDLLAKRAGQKSEHQDLDLTHDEFLTFLEHFKKFIEENS